MKRKLFCIVLMFALLLCGCAVNSEEALQPTGAFVDSTGRAIPIPAKIERIAVTGPLSQIYILPLAGDMLVGVSNAYAEDAALYLPSYILEKTEIGQLYGGRGEMDLEALLAAAPDIVIDIGEPKATTADDLTALTEQTGIPFIHIDATVATAPEAYRTLGKLLGREEKAEELAVWCENTYTNISAMMEKVDADNARKRLLYCLGDTGTYVLTEGSFHAETVNMMSSNVAIVEDVVSSGAGNEVDLEQILVWNPEVIIFAPDSCYNTVANAPQWQSIAAISQGQYYKTPYGPYGWLSSPPAVQRYLGMLWLGELLYPEYTEYDLREEVTSYYKLFYGCELTDEMYQALMINALCYLDMEQEADLLDAALHAYTMVNLKGFSETSETYYYQLRKAAYICHSKPEESAVTEICTQLNITAKTALKNSLNAKAKEVLIHESRNLCTVFL